MLCENNAFNNVINVRESSEIIFINGESVTLNNLTLINSAITSLLSMSAL